MAGRKITQLPTLTTPAATDKLVIVDVSDTSESPQGTSKQIALENLGISGTWTPTITATDFEANQAQTCNYVRNGDYIDFNAIIQVSVVIPATLVETSIEFTVPTSYPVADDLGSEACLGVFQIIKSPAISTIYTVSYTHLRAHET